jgi:ankyrin repeat protein
MQKVTAILVVVLLLHTFASSAQQRSQLNTANTAARAVEKVVPLLQQSARTWSMRSDCISCHHQGLGAMAVALARERGFAIDAALFAEEQSTIKSRLPRAEQAVTFGTTELQTVAVSYSLLALAAGGTSSDVTDVITHRMLGRQNVNGSWSNPGAKRPPIQGSTFSDTALTLRALQLFAPPSRKTEADVGVRRARTWLQQAQPGDTEDAVMQLLGLAWSGGSPNDIRRARERVLALQREDGGWAQIPNRDSDAYATGQSLVALNQAGRLAPTDAAYRKGVGFLLRTQKADGSWLAESRRTWRQGLPYFETGFPHGKHQFISYAAAAWATMALVISSRDQVSPVLMGPPRTATGISVATSTALTPLMRATLFGTRENLQQLIRDSANINETATPLRITALMCAVHDSEKVKLLIAAGADVNAATSAGHTPLLLAADYDGARESVRLLLDAGADIKARTTLPNTVLARAAARGDLELLSLLTRRGATINDVPNGSASLFVAAHDGNLPLITWLLDRGANIETALRLGREPNELTALMVAIDSGQLDAVTLLLARGANVNAHDNLGMTPLFYAVGALDFAATGIIERLLKAGADPQARNNAGQTPLAFAERFDNSQAATQLRNR